MDQFGPLRPTEVSFLAESTPITIIPRQRLDTLPLISLTTPRLTPPQRATVPLWLALILKKQKRCNIVPPSWLSSHTIGNILQWEHDNPSSFSSALPWHWLELSELLLEAASDDIPDANLGGEMDLRVLLRALREVRQSKARDGLKQLEGTYLLMNGLGMMEITELRGFAGMVVDGLRKLGATREEIRRAEEEEEDVDMDDMSTSYRGSTRGGTSRTGDTTVGRSSVAQHGSTVRIGSSTTGFDDDAF